MSERPVRVLYDHQMFAIQQFGGISRIFLELARRVSARPDALVYWYRGYHVDQYDPSSFCGRLSRYWSFERPPIGTGSWSRDRINLQGLRLFSRTILGGTDIYHPSYYDLDVLPLVQSKRVAVTVYDMILERFLGDVERFRPMLEGKRAMVERADVVFVISENTRDDLVEHLGVNPRKTVLAYPASDLTSVPAAPLPSALNDQPYLLYVGTRSKYKNFTVLQEAFAKSSRLRRELKVVCFGGTSGFVEPERRFFAEHGLTDHFVHLPGDDSLLKVLYQHAVGLVYTSRFEGFGMPPLEAMETGCPVICCPVSSIPEVVGDAAMFFDPDSAEELTERLHALLDDTALRARLVTGGLERAQLFSWDRMVEQILAGYNVIL
jgi:glycosyltransferase involved in cell wall biosynthesis